MKPETTRAEPFLSLPAQAVRALWAELARGALERQVVLGAMRSRDDAFLRRVRWEANSYLRIRAAFEALVLARGPGVRIGEAPEDLECGDEIGLALFSAYLCAQHARLTVAARGPHGSESEEAQARQAVFKSLCERFHEGLGCDEEQVRARAAALPLRGDPRAAPRTLTVHGVCVRTEEEAFLAPDEELARVAAVLAELS